MRIYCTGRGENREVYYSSKSKAIAASNWEYHKRMKLYWCNQWYREFVFSAKVDLSKGGIIAAMNDQLEWEVVQKGGWMPNTTHLDERRATC